MKKKKTCLIKERNQFLWWKWVSSHYEHDWTYVSKDERVCDKCGRGEIMVSSDYFDGNRYEDWRKSR
jgi:hypothetical protein